MSALEPGLHFDAVPSRSEAGTLRAHSTCSPLQEPACADVVPSPCVRDGHAQLRETLPQVSFVIGTCFPAHLEDLMCGERSIQVEEVPGSIQGLLWWQDGLRLGIHAGSAVREGTTEMVAGPGLAGAADLVTVSVTGG
jgi:hypothetical protein